MVNLSALFPLQQKHFFLLHMNSHNHIRQTSIYDPILHINQFLDEKTLEEMKRLKYRI